MNKHTYLRDPSIWITYTRHGVTNLDGLLTVDQERCHPSYKICRQAHVIEFRNQYFVVDVVKSVAIVYEEHLSTQFSTIPSNTFANIGVSEIGRMSFPSEPGGCFFGTGTIVAVFQKIGELAFSERAIENIRDGRS